MQHALRVNAIDPSKGFVWRDDEMDLLPSADNMDVAMCRDELRQSAIEMTKIEQALAIAKRAGDKAQTTFLGNQKATLCMRRNPVKARLHRLMSVEDNRLFADAINAVCDEELAARIFAHVRDARNTLIDAAI